MGSQDKPRCGLQTCTCKIPRHPELQPGTHGERALQTRFRRRLSASGQVFVRLFISGLLCLLVINVGTRKRHVKRTQTRIIVGRMQDAGLRAGHSETCCVILDAHESRPSISRSVAIIIVYSCGWAGRALRPVIDPCSRPASTSDTATCARIICRVRRRRPGRR